MRVFLAALSGFSGGIFSGIGAVALLTMLRIVPRIAQLVKAPEHAIGSASLGMAAGATLASLILALDWRLALGRWAAALFGIFSGVFIGLLAISLAEMLDVLPVTLGKLQLKGGLAAIVIAILLGKSLGSILYFLVPIWP